MPAFPHKTPLGDADFLARLVKHLADGGIAALPTDTVPGLAATAGLEGAKSLAALKGYKEPRPFSLHIRNMADLQAAVVNPPPGLPDFLVVSLTAQMTVLLPQEWCSEEFQDWPLLGLRWPQNESWSLLGSKLTGPVFMTSINVQGTAPLVGSELSAWLSAHPEVLVGLEEGEANQAHSSNVLSLDPLPALIRGSGQLELVLPGKRILLVCTGNICRSPLAEVMFEQQLALAWGVRVNELKELGWVVSSAGTFAGTGGSASKHSQTAAREIGLDLNTHQSVNVNDLDARQWDLVLCMSDSHLASLPTALAAKAQMMDIAGDSVMDPYGGDLATYQATREHLAELIRRRIDSWKSWPDSDPN